MTARLHYSKPEIGSLRRMRDEGVKPKTMALVLGRPVDGVALKLWELGLSYPAGHWRHKKSYLECLFCGEDIDDLDQFCGNDCLNSFVQDEQRRIAVDVAATPSQVCPLCKLPTRNGYTHHRECWDAANNQMQKERMAQVAALLIKKAKISAIAAEVGLSEATVKLYKKRILAEARGCL